MRKIILHFLTIVVIGSVIGISSCNPAPSNTSWENPEPFVQYDVSCFVQTALNNDQAALKREYGGVLASTGETIWNRYSMFGKKPKFLTIDRFADGCWLTLTGVLLGEKGDPIHDEAMFYYTYMHNQWQLGCIDVKTFSNGVRGSVFSLNRDIPFK